MFKVHRCQELFCSKYYSFTTIHSFFVTFVVQQVTECPQSATGKMIFR